MLKRVLRSRRARLISVASLVVLAAMPFVIDRIRTGVTVYTGDHGPIRGVNGRTFEGFAVEVKEPRTYAALSFRNRRNEPAVIEAFRISPPLRGGLRLIEASAAADPNRRTTESGAFPGYPAPLLELGRLRPVRGTKIVPGSERGVALVLGLEITRPGVFWWDRIDVDYRYKGRSYTVQNDLIAYFCAPGSVIGDCPDWDEHPRDICKVLGYVPFGENGCIPPGGATADGR
ncbi:MAG: hypothetical protein ACRDZ3_17410 [Acidimicrobiia bacterium]